MQKVDLDVEGMTCTNCALSVTKYLEKQGMASVSVNPITGKVTFDADTTYQPDMITAGIHKLGYKVKRAGSGTQTPEKNAFLDNNKKRFLFCLPFTLILMLHMVHNWLPVHWLMNPWLQLALCLPVFMVGMYFFGRSAVKSFQNGVPNMDVLITVGALAAFVYSLTGAVLGLGNNYLFFETTATIITLVFMGNYLEERSVNATQTALQQLVSKQKVMANMLAFDDKHEEQVFEVESDALRSGDLVLIKTGEQVPADCKILWGDASVDEAIVTGESLLVQKTKKDQLIGGSMLLDGTVKAQVTAAGKDTILSSMINMVQHAQSEKPPLQKMADRISAVFVPVVLVIAVLTFIINYFVVDVTLGAALMRSIATLVISCPCAMGIATPAAIAVGMGRAAKNGILFRNASTLEAFKTIKQVVFDKTGTLTTGKFAVKSFDTAMPEADFKKLVYSIEKFSTHPLATSILAAWKQPATIAFAKVEELKGEGMQASDKEGNLFRAVSAAASGVAGEAKGNIVVTKNGNYLGSILLQDEVRPEAKKVVDWLHKKDTKCILLSGDNAQACEDVARQLGIDEVYSQQTPAQKMDRIKALTAANPTAMVGDGINDAPALAASTIGISLSEASQLAMQSADVVLMNKGFGKLPTALGIGRHTNITIKQNLFWAFLYNIVAIPVAAIGLLTPSLSALAMGLSDVVLGLNSVRLFVKKVI